MALERGEHLIFREARDVAVLDNRIVGIEQEIEQLLHNFRPGDERFLHNIKEYIDRFIGLAEEALQKIEHSKKRAIAEERGMLTNLSDFLLKVTPIDTSLFKNRIDALAKNLAERIEKRINLQQAEGVRAAHGYVPQGFLLKSFSSVRRISRESRRETSIILKANREREDLQAEVIGVLEEYKKQPLWKQIAYYQRRKKELYDKINALIEDYDKEFENSFNIIIDMDIMEVRRLQQIDTLIHLMKAVHFDYRVKDLERIRDEVKKWLRQDTRRERAVEGFIKRCEAIISRNSLYHGIDFNLDGVPLKFNPENFDWSQLVAVHMTNYFPNGGLMQTRLSAEGIVRDTLHFCINGPVGVANMGLSDWGDKKFSILIPMNYFPVRRIEQFRMEDMYIMGNLKIPAGSVILGKYDDFFQAAQEERLGFEEFWKRYNRMHIRLYVIPKEKRAYDAVIELIYKSGRSVQQIYEHEGSWEKFRSLLEERTAKWAERVRKEIGAGSMSHVSTAENVIERIGKEYLINKELFIKNPLNFRKVKFGIICLTIETLIGQSLLTVAEYMGIKKYTRTMSGILNNLNEFLGILIKRLDLTIDLEERWLKDGRRPEGNDTGYALFWFRVYLPEINQSFDRYFHTYPLAVLRYTVRRMVESPPPKSIDEVYPGNMRDIRRAFVEIEKKINEIENLERKKHKLGFPSVYDESFSLNPEKHPLCDIYAISYQ